MFETQPNPKLLRDMVRLSLRARIMSILQRIAIEFKWARR